MIHAAALTGGGFFIGILSFLPSLKKRYAHLGKFFRVKICPRFIESRLKHYEAGGIRDMGGPKKPLPRDSPPGGMGGARAGSRIPHTP